MSIQCTARAATMGAAISVAMMASAAAQSNIATTMQTKLTAATAKLDSSCGDEIKNFCSTVTPGEGRVILCIEAHEDKLSAKCLFDMHEAAKNLSLVASMIKETTLTCRGDVGKLCAQTPAGRGKILQCLIANKASVTQACAATLQKLSDFATN